MFIRGLEIVTNKVFTVSMAIVVVTTSLVLMVSCKEHAEPAPEGAGEQQPAAQPTDAAKQEQAKPADEAQAEKAVEGPDVICAQLVEALKTNDQEKVNALSTEGADKAFAPAPAKKHKAKKAKKGAKPEGTATLFKDAACGEVKEEGDKALVAVSAGGSQHAFPFIKMGDVWKFDVKAYMDQHKDAGKKDNKKGKKKKK